MEDLYLSEKHCRSPDEASWPQVKPRGGWTAESRHSQGWTSQMLPDKSCLCSGGWKWTGDVTKRHNYNGFVFNRGWISLIYFESQEFRQCVRFICFTTITPRSSTRERVLECPNTFPVFFFGFVKVRFWTEVTITGLEFLSAQILNNYEWLNTDCI